MKQTKIASQTKPSHLDSASSGHFRYTVSQAAIQVGLSVATLHQCAELVHGKIQPGHHGPVFTEEHLEYLKVSRSTSSVQVIQSFGRLIGHGSARPVDRAPAVPSKPDHSSWSIQCSDVVSLDHDASSKVVYQQHHHPLGLLEDPQRLLRQLTAQQQILIAVAEAFCAQCLDSCPADSFSPELEHLAGLLSQYKAQQVLPGADKVES